MSIDFQKHIPEDTSDVHVETTLPKSWEEEVTFNDMLYEWMQRSPWFILSVAVHGILAAIAMLIPWHLFGADEETIIEAQIEQLAEDLFEDPGLKTNNDRVAQEERLIPEIETTISKLSKTEVLGRCEKAGLPFAPVTRPEDLFEDPQLNQGAGLLETVFPDGVKTKMPRTPIEMSDHDFDLRLEPPHLGEHTREILSDLGYTSQRIEELSEAGIVKGVQE